MIIRGKDKGETGNIKRVIRTQNRVIVEGKNLVSDKHGTHYHSLGILFYCSKVQYSIAFAEVSVISIPLSMCLAESLLII